MQLVAERHIQDAAPVRHQEMQLVRQRLYGEVWGSEYLLPKP
jgi:hypothetical protein